MAFMDAFGNNIGGLAGDTIGSLIGARDTSNVNTNANTSGTKTQQKVLSPEAINKLVYDVLSSDQGLAALANGEGASGGFGSSTKKTLAQDLVVKLVGELANVTAPTTITEATSSASTQAQTKKKKVSVICTELTAQGKFSTLMYALGQEKFQDMDQDIVEGYHLWAIPLVNKM